MLDRDFDMARIARYVLGRYWNGAGEEDRRAFAGLFQQWVVRTYAGRLQQYSGEKVRVAGSRAEGDGAVVTTEITPRSGPPLKVEWRVSDRGGGLKIVDVDVAGISMALTEREEIASAIQRNGGTVAALNRRFAEKLGLAATADANGR
jgi:phospholipid transport system substrate-binding protein